MPIYVYQCSACKKEVEVVRAVADIDIGPDESRCNWPDDGDKFTQGNTFCEFHRIIPKLVTPGIKGFVLQGAGWANDNYRSRTKAEKGEG
jgi:predicted nucleic acid-binding Zn ribbon protein